MTRRTARLLAVGLVAAGLTLVAVQPAAAYSSPPTLTFTKEHADENPLVTYRVECPLTSVSVIVLQTGTSSGGAPVSLRGDYTLDGSGVWTDNYFLESFFGRDTDATVTAECYDGPLVGGLATGTLVDDVTEIVHADTVNAVITAPATLAVNAPLTVTGNCGTSSNITSYIYYVYDLAFTQVGAAVTVPYTGPANYSIALGTPASLGFAAGDGVRVQVLCQSVTPVAHTASNRTAAPVTLTAAVVAPPVTPAGPTGPTLAATGSESMLPLAAGAGLVALGAAVLLVRRRREAVVRGR